jgi:hypothetical protein
VTTGATTRAPCSGLEVGPGGGVDTGQLTAPMAVRTRPTCFAVVIEYHTGETISGIDPAPGDRGVVDGERAVWTVQADRVARLQPAQLVGPVPGMPDRELHGVPVLGGRGDRKRVLLGERVAV